MSTTDSQRSRAPGNIKIAWDKFRARYPDTTLDHRHGFSEGFEAGYVEGSKAMKALIVARLEKDVK